jgi:hypothetical protein
MNPLLQETTPQAFVHRAMSPSPRRVSALVTDDSMVEATVRALRRTLNEMSKTFAEATLEEQLRTHKEHLRVDAMIVATTSDDAAFWQWVDHHRSRVSDEGTTLLLLSRVAAESMSRHAPHLVSLLGSLRYCPSSPLQSLIDSAASARYPELYEAADQRPGKDLEQVIDEILNMFGEPRTDQRAWRRLGYMGHALLLEVLPTIAAYWPDGTAVANATLAALERWLDSADNPIPLSEHIDGPMTSQAIAEAVDVLRNAARLTDAARARDAAAVMIDDCLQGYAVFPGSEGRRTLFDWWLHVVVPETWALRHPARFIRTSPHAPIA